MGEGAGERRRCTKMAEDILDTVRECLLKGQQIRELNNKICVGGRNFLKTTETTFPIKQIKAGRKSNKCRKFYNLEEISFFIENVELPHYQYTKKAQDKGVECVRKLDRKPLLTRIGGETLLKRKSRPIKRTTGGGNKSEGFSTPIPLEPEPANRKQAVEKDSGESGERQKPHLRTYSRKRSSRSSSRRQSLASEDQLDVDTGVVNNDIAEELISIKTENKNLECSLRNIISFLKDHLGATEEQLTAMQECESNTVELSNIASSIKDKIAYSGVLPNGNTHSPANFESPSFCYKAVKHPSRGWEMRKLHLSSVLSGHEDLNSTEVEETKSSTFEESLSKGTVLLKRVFSMLISQMRESNRFTTHEEFDLFCQKIITDCLAESVESFRELFSGLCSSKLVEDESEEVDRWVAVCRAELGKLFLSLTKTLQSLRDIPNIQQKQPISLFHLPEPTFSLALNPAKVTHSVVLEMYVRFGVAELQGILKNLLGCGSINPMNNSFTSFSPSANKKINNTNNNESKIEHSWNPSTSEEIPEPAPPQLPTDVSPQHPNDIEFVSVSGSPTSQGCKNDFSPHSLNPETIVPEIIDAESSSASSTSLPCSPQPHPVNRVLFQQNRNSDNILNSNSTYQTRRSSESDRYSSQYSVFKASLGNVLVSSFKKQIQEKIQARNSDIL
ncbi:uncharacterized protein LOC113206379 [Frankliniella occidentalis]|uniref:Uncharacterized protein LOC113206379 n=1 Tax=Frankliniella occidentalis TaxID=133901 RepID=A0A6J1SAL1_FRAOC|nr:uncharacterized protein LOC113206379 [Frankliniella occidentalis]